MAEKTETIGKLSDGDLVLMQSARDAMEKAQTVWQFVAGHLSALYKLDKDTEIMVNGDIVRNVSDAPADEDEQ